jgi:hypothetical protein
MIVGRFKLRFFETKWVKFARSLNSLGRKCSFFECVISPLHKAQKYSVWHGRSSHSQSPDSSSHERTYSSHRPNESHAPQVTAHVSEISDPQTQLAGSPHNIDSSPSEKWPRSTRLASYSAEMNVHRATRTMLAV